ncbi:hypothetical protein QYM36_002020 [Artemia franciscana]|nr:hypothetical protein QYM36_002020 [Artemia franciscana]
MSGRIVSVDIEPSLTETPLKESLASLSWSVESRRLKPLIISSTKFSTKTVAHTQRFLVDCIDSEEVYSPLCPKKRININWGYHGDHGPDKWSELEPICATGEEESPIALETNETISAELPDLEMKGYDKHPKEYLMQNNGHTLVVSLKDSILPSVRKGGLRSEYIFRQMHFHWGETSEEGSEHVINGKRYPMEIHLVHYNKKYGSVPKAVSHRDGLEVLAVFVEISDEANQVFEKMLSNLEQLISSNSAVTLPGDSFVLADFLPIDKNFYRYHGSLTTPGCNQAVFWTIFSEPITMSEDQIDQFRRLLDHENHPMSGNFRPLQRLYGREILRSF